MSHYQRPISDRQFNQLRQLIDANFLTEQFAAIYNERSQAGLTVSQVFVNRVFPHKQTGFAMELEVALNTQHGKQNKRFLAQYVDQNIEKKFDQITTQLKKTRRSQLPKAPQNPEKMFVISACKLIVRQLGLDEQLNGLILFNQPKNQYIELNPDQRRSLGGHFKMKHQLLSHRLGKRCLFRCNSVDGEDVSLIAKIYKSRTTKGAQTFSNMQALQKKHFDLSSRLRISHPIHWCSDYQILWMEDVQGKHLFQLKLCQQSKALFDTGCLLAKLHQTELNLQSIHTIEDEIALLEQWTDRAGQLRPKLTQRLQNACAFVRKSLCEVKNQPASLVHRDFYDQQLIFNDTSIALIDFDTLALSYPELDIGNYLAHLKLRRLQGIEIDRKAETYFLSGYRNRSDCNFSDLKIWEKASLLRLSCLYAFRTKWKDLTEPLLEAVYV